jgi:hypothetical protein
MQLVGVLAVFSNLVFLTLSDKLTIRLTFEHKLQRTIGRSFGKLGYAAEKVSQLFCGRALPWPQTGSPFPQGDKEWSLIMQQAPPTRAAGANAVHCAGVGLGRMDDTG